MSSALPNPETSILIQKRHFYTRNQNSETSGDSKSAFLHCGDVSGHALMLHQLAEFEELLLLMCSSVNSLFTNNIQCNSWSNAAKLVVVTYVTVGSRFVIVQ